MFVLTDSGQSILSEDINVAIEIYICVLMKTLNSDGQHVYKYKRNKQSPHSHLLLKYLYHARYVMSFCVRGIDFVSAILMLDVWN